MKRAVLFTVLCGLLTGTVLASAEKWLPPKKYGVQTTIYFTLVDSNSPWRVYETAPAAADVHVFQDGASEAQATNAVTDLGRSFSLVLTATEMTAALVTVDVNDASAPPLFGDTVLYLPTFGHASAFYPVDWSDSVPPVDVSYINGVATTSVSTVSANIGTTQPVNFTGTGGSAYVNAQLLGANDNAVVDVNGADVWAATTRTLSAATNITSTGGTITVSTGAVTVGSMVNGAVTAAAVATGALDADALAADAVDEIWDELMTAHKTKQSAAWWIQRPGGSDPLQITGTAQAGGSTNSIVLQPGQILANNACTPCTITLLTGTGAPAIRTGLSFVAATNTLTIAGTWPGSTPNATTTYLIQASPTSYFASEGVAQSAIVGSIVLASGGVRADNLTGLLQILSGTGSGTTVYNVTDSYDANDTVVVSGAWAAGTPDNTSWYVFTPSGGFAADNSSAGMVTANVLQWNGDDVAAVMDANDVEVAVADVFADYMITAARILKLGELDKIGTPVALDGGTADLASMLKKMADDNDGADFDATTDSLYAIATDANAILTDTAAADTANELRTLLTGGTNALLTTANLPTNFAALDINASGQVDIYQIENVDATTQLGTVVVTLDASDLLDAAMAGHDIDDSFAWWIKDIRHAPGVISR